MGVYYCTVILIVFLQVYWLGEDVIMGVFSSMSMCLPGPTCEIELESMTITFVCLQ